MEGRHLAHRGSCGRGPLLLDPLQEVRGLSLDDIWVSFQNVGFHQWALSILCALLAYAVLAYYDRLALRHLGRSVSLPFVAATSFTTYALSHNIGASVFSGAVVDTAPTARAA